MAGTSVVEAQAILNRERGISAPAYTAYAGLLLDDPDQGGQEVSYPTYARQPITYAAPTGKLMASSVDALFPLPVGGDAGIAVYIGIWDAPTGGVLRNSRLLTGSALERAITTTRPLRIAAGSLVREVR